MITVYSRNESAPFHSGCFTFQWVGAAKAWLMLRGLVSLVKPQQTQCVTQYNPLPGGHSKT